MAVLTIWLVIVANVQSPTGINPASMTVMKASWYGAELQGHKMANGEKFDRHALTVAHRKLPFGTTVVLVNPSNGKSTKAVVTDRGPFVRGRDMDVSEAVAGKLGMQKQGLATILVAKK